MSGWLVGKAQAEETLVKTVTGEGESTEPDVQFLGRCLGLPTLATVKEGMSKNLFESSLTLLVGTNISPSLPLDCLGEMYGKGVKPRWMESLEAWMVGWTVVWMGLVWSVSFVVRMGLVWSVSFGQSRLGRDGVDHKEPKEALGTGTGGEVCFFSCTSRQ